MWLHKIVCPDLFYLKDKQHTKHQQLLYIFCYHQDQLFYSATYAVNGLDYDKALDYYYQLKALNYSGEGAVYWAVNKTTQKEESFSNKTGRELFIKTGTHEKPRDEKVDSKRSEIYKNIALILVNKGKTEEANAFL